MNIAPRFCLILLLSIGVFHGHSFAQPSPPSDPAEQAKTGAVDENFTLENSLSLRDPFRRPVIKDSNDFASGGNIPELERFELDKFKLVGLIMGPKKNKALLLTPDNKMHVVSENAYIGTRRGTIRKIAPGQVVVEERVVNLLGQEEKIETLIQFSKDKETK